MVLTVSVRLSQKNDFLSTYENTAMKSFFVVEPILMGFMVLTVGVRQNRKAPLRHLWSRREPRVNPAQTSTVETPEHGKSKFIFKWKIEVK